MACFSIKLSEHGRLVLWNLFILLTIVLCIFDIVIITYAIYISIFIAPYIPTEKAIIIFIYTVFGMSGMELLTYYGLGIRVCRKCFTEAHKKHSKYLLRIWLFAGYSMVVNMLVIGTMTASISNHVSRSIHHSLDRGIGLYLKDLSWKKSLDILQYKMKCCGALAHTDWHQITWRESSILTEDSITLESLKNANQSDKQIEPWSCCTLNYTGPCYHDPIQMPNNINGNSKLSSIHQVGCLRKLTIPLQNGFLMFILASILTFSLQIVLTILSRFIYTSYRNAVILGNRKGMAPGWLWGTNNDMYQLYGNTIRSADSEDSQYDKQKTILNIFQTITSKGWEKKAKKKKRNKKNKNIVNIKKDIFDKHEKTCPEQKKVRTKHKSRLISPEVKKTNKNAKTITHEDDNDSFNDNNEFEKRVKTYKNIPHNMKTKIEGLNQQINEYWDAPIEKCNSFVIRTTETLNNGKKYQRLKTENDSISQSTSDDSDVKISTNSHQNKSV